MSTLVSDRVRNLELPLGGEKVYLNLAGDSGTAVTDKSGNGFSGVVTGGTFSAGPSPIGGQVLDMRGSAGDGIVITPTSTTLDITTAFTIELWFKMDTLTAYPGLFELFDKSLNAGAGGRHIRIYFNGDSDDINVDSESVPATGLAGDLTKTTGWHHIALTYSHPTIILYIDGVAASSFTTASLAWTRATGDLFNVCKTSAGLVFDGKLASFAYFLRALTAAEVRFRYEQCNDLVNYIPWLIKEYWTLQHTPFFTSGWVDPTADLDRGDWINFAPMPGTASPINLEEDKRRHDPKLQLDIWTNKGRARADLNWREIDRIFNLYRRTPHHSKIDRIQWTEPLDMGSEKQGFQRYSFDVTGLRWSVQ